VNASEQKTKMLPFEYDPTRLYGEAKLTSKSTPFSVLGTEVMVAHGLGSGFAILDVTQSKSYLKSTSVAVANALSFVKSKSGAAGAGICYEMIAST